LARYSIASRIMALMDRRLVLNIFLVICPLLAVGAMFAAHRSAAADRAYRVSLEPQVETALAKAKAAIDRAQDFADKLTGDWTSEDVAKLRGLKQDAQAAMQEANRVHGLLASRRDHAMAWSLISVFFCFLPIPVWLRIIFSNKSAQSKLRDLPTSP
jgi:hypothetical protein